MTFCIYAIVDPRNDQVFYVGHTSYFSKRCEQHREGTDSISGLTIRQIKANGFVPLFIKLEICADKAAALMAEIFWIELFRSRGAKLANAQGFAGYEERSAKRGQLQKGLQSMERAKARESRLEAVANGRPPRQGKAWSATEMRRLHALLREGLSPEQIADRLGRSLAAVEARLFKPFEEKSKGRPD